MTEFEAQVIADLNVLKSQMGQLMGIGQPGRLEQLEARVSSTEQGAQKMQGYFAALGGLLAFAHLALAWMGAHHS